MSVTSESRDFEPAGPDQLVPAPESTRILLRARRDLTKHASPAAVAQKNLIGNNSGNTIFTHAVHRVVSTAGAQVSVDAAPENVARAGEINEKYDQYIVPLANAFRPSFVESLDKYSALIEQLKIPVVIVGVGVQLNAESNNPERLEPVRQNIDRFMRAVLKRSPSVGVRGETTYNYLRSIGYSDDEVTVIGCPSLFQYGHLKIRDFGEVTKDSLITLNVSPYLTKMGPISAANTVRYPNLRYVPQDILTLRNILYGEEPPNADSHHPQVPYRSTDFLMRKGRTDFFVDPTTWTKWLAQRDFSFGSRIHGNIASLLAGTPAVVIAHDSRTRELADYHEIPYRLLEDVPDDVDARDLFATADFTGFHANQQQRFDNYLKFLEHNGVRHIFSGNPRDKASVAAFDAKVEVARNKRPTTSVGPAGVKIRRQRLRARQAGGTVLRKARPKR